jgi:Holliday junction DNA helicase RuvA
MYAYLEGKLTYKSPALVHLDVQGVGYELNISLHTWSAIQHLSTVKLYTWLHVKDDAHVLYGFFEASEKEMFLLLTSVSGVGAATARMMLSYLRPDEVAAAIAGGDVKTLESVKGIGRKSAERLVLELKDKVLKIAGEPRDMPAVHHNSLESDALDALAALGIPRAQAGQSVKKVRVAEPGINQLEELIKKALKAI